MQFLVCISVSLSALYPKFLLYVAGIAKDKVAILTATALLQSALFKIENFVQRFSFQMFSLLCVFDLNLI